MVKAICSHFSHENQGKINPKTTSYCTNTRHYVQLKKFTFLNENYPVNSLYLPEPEDLFTASSIVSVNGVSLPVDQVDLLHPTQHYLHGSQEVL